MHLTSAVDGDDASSSSLAAFSLVRGTGCAPDLFWKLR
jgi:hypothetical protein